MTEENGIRRVLPIRLRAVASSLNNALRIPAFLIPVKSGDELSLAVRIAQKLCIVVLQLCSRSAAVEKDRSLLGFRRIYFGALCLKVPDGAPQAAGRDGKGERIVGLQ